MRIEHQRGPTKSTGKPRAQWVQTDHEKRPTADAEGEMGVENARRSEKFIAWQAAAEEYYSLLELNGSGDQKVLAERKASLDELEILFNENPAWVALLKAERKSKELRP